MRSLTVVTSAHRLIVLREVEGFLELIETLTSKLLGRMSESLLHVDALIAPAGTDFDPRNPYRRD